MMRRFSALLFLSLICSIGLKAEVSGDTDASREISLRDAPQELIEAWLRFHEMDLCQDLDTVFEFDESGMKVWCLIEDKKKYQKFQQLLEPLMDSYRIELCATVPPIKMKSDETNDPPPNLWENEKLRSYLGDLSSPVRLRSGIIDFTPADIEQITNIFDSDILKRLLIIYADQVLKWNKYMDRYAMDLPVLARLATDPGATDNLRYRAIAACTAHSKGLDKFLKKLESNLSPAIPKSKKTKYDSYKSEKTGNTGKALVEKAEQISAAAQDLYQSIENFIHPKNFTVDLEELRSPNILVTIYTLETMCEEFQTKLKKYHSK